MAGGARPSDWFDLKVIWAISPRYKGPVLVRGRQIDGRGEVGFGSGGIPYEELQLPPVAETRWRDYGTRLRVRRGGCFALQIDTTRGAQVVVIEIR